MRRCVVQAAVHPVDEVGGVDVWGVQRGGGGGGREHGGDGGEDVDEGGGRVVFLRGGEEVVEGAAEGVDVGVRAGEEVRGAGRIAVVIVVVDGFDFGGHVAGRGGEVNWGWLEEVGGGEIWGGGRKRGTYPRVP